MYIEQAYKGKHEFWRYLMGVVTTFFCWQFIGVIPLLTVGFIKAGSLEAFMEAAQDNFLSLGLDTNLFLVLMIFSFACGLFGIWFSNKFFHQQKFTKLTTSRKKVDWKRILFSFSLVFTISILLFIPSYLLEPESFQWNFELVPFLILLVISFLLLPLQTSFEEYLFRGYLMQWIGILAKNRWVPLVITSVSFGVLHGLNPEVAKLGNVMMVFYIGTGLLLGIMTLMDEGMELALGFHAANNIVAATLVTTDWSALQTNAMFMDTSEPSAGIDVILPILIMYPIFLFIFARKYKWYDWKERLTGKIIVPKPVSDD